jgi:hypothetical protein
MHANYIKNEFPFFRSSLNTVELVPREPPTDLPMDSDIGLRSPCDGLLAKRRQKFRTKQQSSHSDSNSCDTPTSENSPRDLTTMSRNMTIASEASEGQSRSKPNTPTWVRHSPSPTNFKHPHAKPESLRLTGLKEVADLPAHYTPSPLAVPSPNWSAVERYFGEAGALLKTPKNLDTNLFDFLTPATPRSAKLSYGGRVEGFESDRYQRLSPHHHSPRDLIPEAPTDFSISNRSPILTKLPPAEAAEDLSMTASKSLAQQRRTPPQQIDLHHQLKQEFPSRYARCILGV